MDKPDGPRWGTGFGQSTVVEDGRLVVGAPADYQGSHLTGSVFVYRQESGRWVDPVKLMPDTLARRFGADVAIQGRLIAVGAPATMSPDAGKSGAVYIYEEGIGGWGLRTRLAGCTGADAGFGFAVDMDDEWLVVGAVPPRTNGTYERAEAGSVCVYRRETGGGFTLASHLSGNVQSVPDQFGVDLALHAGRLAVAAREGNDVGLGFVRIYKYDGEAWNLEAHLSPGGAVSSLGSSVALSGDTLVAGNIHDPPNQAGAVYIYKRDASAWRLAERLVASVRRPAALFGNRVAIDAGIVAVAAIRDGDLVEGGIYVYPREASGLGPPVALRLPRPEGLERLGESVTVSSEAVFAATLTGRYGPSLYVFDRTFLTTPNEPAPTVPLRSVLVYPNPTTGTVTLRVTLPTPGAAFVRVYDMLGRLMATHVRQLGSGVNEVKLDGGNLEPGNYSVSVTTGMALISGSFTIFR